MSARSGPAEKDGAHLLYAASPWPGLLRLTLAAVVVAAVAALALVAVEHAPSEQASEVDDAVLVDLPAALASAGVGGDTNGPEQQASVATPPTPSEPLPPQDQPPAPAADAAASLPPPTEAPPAVAAAPDQVAMAPAGDETTAPPSPLAGADETPRASAHALSLWQRAMVAHLAAAKRGLHASGRHGTAVVAFTLGADGRIVSDRIAQGSGDPSLDAAAKHLIEAAAPYPRPPDGAGDLSFTLPIRFRP